MNNIDFSDIRIVNNRVSVRYQDKWADKGHLINSGMVSQDKRFFYVNIPKNNSSFIKEKLSAMGWQFTSLEDYPDATPIIVLRDPVKRWVSGIAEYLMLYHLDTLDQNGYYTEQLGYKKLIGESLLMDVLLKNLTFDDHTEKQIMFLQGVTDLSKAIYLKSDNDFSNTFDDFLTTAGYQCGDITSPINDDANYPRRKELKDFFSWYLQSYPKWVDSIRGYYDCDYQLINSVKFYKKDSE